MDNSYLNDAKLPTLLNRLKGIFATKAAVKQVEDDTKQYVTEVDYNEIVNGFNATEVITL